MAHHHRANSGALKSPAIGSAKGRERQKTPATHRVIIPLKRTNARAFSSSFGKTTAYWYSAVAANPATPKVLVKSESKAKSSGAYIRVNIG
jgi:hypothetical protein